ncbi:MAG: lipopolysaccharide biosynthesis protein [Alloprevotella sp.]
MQEKSSNFNQALWLGIGQLCTFAIAFVTAPILSRYFDKIEYATYRQILYVYGSLQSLFVMGLPNVFAYFIPRLNHGQQKALINRLTLVFIAIGLILSVSLYLCADWLGEVLNNPELANGLRLFSPFPLFTLPTMGVEGIYTALRRAKEIAFYHIFSKSAMFLCIVLPVIIWNTGYREAIIGWGVASFLTFLVAMYMKSQPYLKVESETFPNMMRSVFGYSLPLMGAFIAGFFVNSADQFFISRYYGPQTFAEFSNGCFSIPIVAMIAGSVQSVLLPLFSKAEATQTINEAIKSYTNAVCQTTILLFPLLLFVMFFTEGFVVALFGEKYISSAPFMRIYILRDFCQIFPYFAVLMALGYSRMYMNLHIVGAIIIILADILLIKLGFSAPCVVVVSTLFQISCRGISFLFIYKKNGIQLISTAIIKQVLSITLHCSLVLALLIIADQWLRLDNIFIRMAVLALIFYIVIFSTGPIIGISYTNVLRQLRHSKN